MAESSRFYSYLDWAIKGVVSTALLALIGWVWNAEGRVTSLEHDKTELTSKVAKLESKEDGYQQLTTAVAVLAAEQKNTNDRLGRIELLLTR